jgi:hypothetical protein
MVTRVTVPLYSLLTAPVAPSLRKGHTFQANRLNCYTLHPSAVSDPYFRAHIKLMTSHPNDELNRRLERFRQDQGAGLAIIDTLQSPTKVAIGFFARSSPAMILRHYIKATNAALVLKGYPPVLLLWDSSLHPPASKWDAFANIRPASALVAYSTEATVTQAVAGLRFLYSDPSALPPLGRCSFAPWRNSGPRNCLSSTKFFPNIYNP